MKMKKWNQVLWITFLLTCVFAIPTCAKGLEGVWRMSTVEPSSSVVNYKVFTADGFYYNLRGNAEESVQEVDAKGIILFRKITPSLAPYKITRSGTYKKITSDLYVEQLDNYFGREVSPIQKILISYHIQGKKMTIMFQLGEDVYREVYKKVSGVGR